MNYEKIKHELEYKINQSIVENESEIDSDWINQSGVLINRENATLFLNLIDNESALIKRNEELEAMLEEYQKCRNYKDDEWKEAIDGFRKLDKKISELLNKK